MSGAICEICQTYLAGAYPSTKYCPDCRPFVEQWQARERHKQNGQARGPGYETDRPLAVPPKPCQCCGKQFQPTLSRRMLCAACYSDGARLVLDAVAVRLPE